MKLKTIQLFVCGIAISLFSIGCSSEADLPIESKEASLKVEEVSTLKNTEKIKFKKETSLLVGRLLSNEDVMSEVTKRMTEVSPDGEIVSFAYLLGKDKGLRKNEMAKTISKEERKNSLFAKALYAEIITNKADYPIIDQMSNKIRAISKTGRLAEPATPFTDENLQIYSPYNEINGYPEIPVTSYYTSEEMEDGSPTNDGMYFDRGSWSYVSSMDNDLIDTNPSFIISVIDDCDIIGGTCETTELFAAGPPPLTTGPPLLTYNVNHNDIPDQDFVTTRIPMIKINGTSWTGFGSTHQKFSIYRGGIDSGVTQNADGTVSVAGKGFKIGEDFRTKRKNARNKNWINFDREFDVDWNQSESSHQIVFFSLHNWRGTVEEDFNVKYGYKYNAVTGVWEGTIEPTGSTNLKIRQGEAIFRSNAELTRRQVLSTIIGVGSTGKTQNDGGIEYNVKSVGIVDYYFKHWYTDL